MHVFLKLKSINFLEIERLISIIMEKKKEVKYNIVFDQKFIKLDSFIH
jgi:hypothetical protein